MLLLLYVGAMVSINVYKVEELNTFLKQQLSLILALTFCFLTFVNYLRGSIVADTSNNLTVSVFGLKKKHFGFKTLDKMFILSTLHI